MSNAELNCFEGTSTTSSGAPAADGSIQGLYSATTGNYASSIGDYALTFDDLPEPGGIMFATAVGGDSSLSGGSGESGIMHKRSKSDAAADTAAALALKREKNTSKREKNRERTSKARETKQIIVDLQVGQPTRCRALVHGIRRFARHQDSAAPSISLHALTAPLLHAACC
jgi:hypothetical protein